MNESLKKVLYMTGTLALMGGTAYLVYNLLKKRPKTFGELAMDTKQTLVDAPSEIKAVVTGKYEDESFPLKKGSGGKRVESLQRFLKKETGINLVIDGKFGDKTEKAVLEQQTPFDTFKGMYPDAVKGQVSQKYFDLFVKGRF